MVNVPLIILCLVLIWEGPLITHLPAWVATLAIFAVVVVLCDLIPKLLAISTAYRISALGVFTLKVMMPLLDRVGHLLENASNSVIDRLTPAKLRVRPRISDEELETLVEMGEAEGTLQEAEGEMIQEIIKLGDKTAKDCMTPRVDTFAVPDDLPNEEAIALFRAAAPSPRPRLCRNPRSDRRDRRRETIPPRSLAALHRDADRAVVSCRKRCRRWNCCAVFFPARRASPIVVDEFGGTEGIITLADIIEEILSDAAPLGDAELYIEPLEDGRFLVSGNARLDDLTEHLGFELVADGIDTIGGYVFNRLGYLPNVGARLEIPRLAITVRRVSRKRIEEMLLEKTAAGAEEDPGRSSRRGNMIAWFVILVCWVVSFVFAGIEAGLLSLDQVRLRHQVKLRNHSAILLDQLQKKPERLLATVLLVTNFADIAGLLLLTKLLVSFGHARLSGRAACRRADLSFPARRLAEIALSPLSLSCPRRLRRSARFHFATSSGRFSNLARRLGQLLFRRTTAPPRLFAAREDLKQLAVESERQGALTSAERAMIHNVVDFRTVKVSDVMVPRTQIVAAPAETTVPELLELSSRTGIDRVPVMSEDGSALGLVNVFDVLLDQISAPRAGHLYAAIVSAAETNPPIASFAGCAPPDSPLRRSWTISGN